MTTIQDVGGSPSSAPDDDVDVDADARTAYARRMGHDLTMPERAARARCLADAGPEIARITRTA